MDHLVVGVGEHRVGAEHDGADVRVVEKSECGSSTRKPTAWERLHHEVAGGGVGYVPDLRLIAASTARRASADT